MLWYYPMWYYGNDLPWMWYIIFFMLWSFWENNEAQWRQLQALATQNNVMYSNMCFIPYIQHDFWGLSWGDPGFSDCWRSLEKLCVGDCIPIYLNSWGDFQSHLPWDKTNIDVEHPKAGKPFNNWSTFMVGVQHFLLCLQEGSMFQVFPSAGILIHVYPLVNVYRKLLNMAQSK